MPGSFLDTNLPPGHGTGAHRLQDLPRGVVAPPPELLAQVTRERAQFPPEIYTDAYAKRVLDDGTLAHYFAGLDVAYRSVPEGVQILAVGAEEIGEFVKGKRQEELLTFTIKEP